MKVKLDTDEKEKTLDISEDERREHTIVITIK